MQIKNSTKTPSEKQKIHISVALMLKNEADGILLTLNSLLPTMIRTVFVYDTGSSDGTPDIVRDFCKKNNFKLHMITGEFEDFSKSRNVLLDFCDSRLDRSLGNPARFLLLLDSRDEVKNSQHLLPMCYNMLAQGASACLVAQQWTTSTPMLQTYFNIRLILAGRNWRFEGVVHEALKRTVDINPEHNRLIKAEGYPHTLILYQDRVKDNGKSAKRLSDDYGMLLKSHQQDPKCARTIYYLGHTCKHLATLNKDDAKFLEAIEWFKKRGVINLTPPGTSLDEEAYHSWFQAGLISYAHLKLAWEDVALPLFMKALKLDYRAETLVLIGDYYLNTAHKPALAYTFVYPTLLLENPVNKRSLIVDELVYYVLRYQFLAAICEELGMEEQAEALLKQALAGSPGYDPRLRAELETRIQAYTSHKKDALKQVLKNKIQSARQS